MQCKSILGDVPACVAVELLAVVSSDIIHQNGVTDGRQGALIGAGLQKAFKNALFTAQVFPGDRFVSDRARAGHIGFSKGGNFRGLGRERLRLLRRMKEVRS